MWYELSGAHKAAFLLVMLWPLIVWAATCILREIERSIAPVYPRDVYNPNKNHTVIVPNTHTNNGVVNKVKRTVSTSGLLDNERKKAPKATFFGKMDGEEVHSEGPYEPKYLNTFEKQHWDRIKGPILKQEGAKEAIEAVKTGYYEQNPEKPPFGTEKNDEMPDSDELASFFKAK